MRRARWFLAVIAAAACAYFAVLLRNTCYVAGGSDSSGYLNEAKMIASGQTSIVVEPLRTMKLDSTQISAFTPLGFAPAQRPRRMVPTYPPGYPMHMALFGLIGGWSIAPFLVSPIAAMVCLGLIYLLGRQLGLSQAWSLAAVLVLAAYPAFVFQATQPMSDVLATLWAMAAVLLALKERPLLAGMAFGIGVVIRPTSILMIVPLLLVSPRSWVLGPDGAVSRIGTPRTQHPAPRTFWFALGALPFAIGMMLWNRTLYGSPWKFGYDSIFDMLDRSFFAARFPHYAFWLAILLPLVFPLGLATKRWFLIAWFAVFYLFHCFYGPYETWWYLRFLLPATPPLILGAMLFLRRFRLAGALIPLILAVQLWQGHSLHVLSMDEAESIYPESVRWAEARLPKDALVVSLQLSGAFLYYADRFTARWETIDADRFQLLRAYAANANLRWYAVLFEFEQEEVRKRFPGKWTQLGENRGIVLWRYDG